MARTTPAEGAPATRRTTLTRDELFESFMDAGLVERGNSVDGSGLVMARGTTFEEFISTPLAAFNRKSLRQILNEEQIRSLWVSLSSNALHAATIRILSNVGTEKFSAAGYRYYRLSEETLSRMYSGDQVGVAPAAVGTSPAAAPARAPSPPAAPARDDITELLERMKRIKIRPDHDPAVCDYRIFALKYRGQTLGDFMPRSTYSLFQNWYIAQNGSQREQELEGHLRDLVEAHNRAVAERTRFTVDRNALASELSLAQEGFNPTSPSGVNDIWEKPLGALRGYTLRQIGINGEDVVKWLKRNGDLNEIVAKAEACAAYGPEVQVAYAAPEGAAAARGGTPAREERPDRGRRSPSPGGAGHGAWSPRAGGAADRGDDVNELLERMRAIRESGDPDPHKTDKILKLPFRERNLGEVLGGPANFNVGGWLRATPDRLVPIEGRLRRVLEERSPAVAAGAAVQDRPPSPERTPPAGGQEQKPTWGRWARSWFGGGGGGR